MKFCHSHTSLALRWAKQEGSKKREAINMKQGVYEVWNKFHSTHWLAKHV